MAQAIVALIFLALGGGTAESSRNPGSGTSLKYISSCEIDLDRNGEADIALLVETVRGRELIVLLKTEKGYNTYLVSTDKPTMYLSCSYGNTVRKTVAGEGHDSVGQVYETPGAYLELYQPECCSVAYFWNGSGFTEAVTSD